jgi:hypothetical protein
LGADLTAFQLRDVLLALDPLDRDWVARVNAAEAEFWRRSARPDTDSAREDAPACARL